MEIGILEIGFLAVLYIFLSGVVGLFVPSLAYRYAVWKNKKRGVAALEKKLKIWMYIVSFFSMASGCYLALRYLPVWKFYFFMIFLMIAVFGTIVDSLLRIIGNEMILCMLFIGIIYRISDGGFYSLLTSLLVMLAVVAVFALASYITLILKRVRGVGMGDIKLAMVIAIIVGMNAAPYFVLGMAAAMMVFVLYKLISTPFFVHIYMHEANTFPMCGPIMFGLISGLIGPYMFTIW